MSNTEDHKEATVYELGYLILPSISEDKLPNVVDSIKKIIKDSGASELDSEMPHRRELAYTMAKTVGASKYVVNDAYMGWIKFEGEPSVANEVKTKVEKMDEILRFLIVKTTRETIFTFAQAREAEEARNRAILPEESLEAEEVPQPEVEPEQAKVVEDETVVE